MVKAEVASAGLHQLQGRYGYAIRESRLSPVGGLPGPGHPAGTPDPPDER
jgi:hypothetical protein